MNKIEIHAYCLQLLTHKLEDLDALIADARAASNNDTKSSMGDKYETTREMMQIEIDKLNRQRFDTTQMILALKIQNPAKKCELVQNGALVQTDKFWFYIATGLGKINFKNLTLMVISPKSPIGKLMLNKRSGDIVVVNAARYLIHDIL
jgi:hypothetical protein